MCRADGWLNLLLERRVAFLVEIKCIKVMLFLEWMNKARRKDGIHPHTLLNFQDVKLNMEQRTAWA